MNLSRRDLLKLALVGAAHPLLPVRGIVSQAFAAPGAADAKFLLVFLRGGYDAASVLVPVGSDFYYEVRPTIALPKPDPANPAAAMSLARPDDAVTWGLHPALGDSMLPLWQRASSRSCRSRAPRTSRAVTSKRRTASKAACRSRRRARRRTRTDRGSSIVWRPRSTARPRRSRSPMGCPW